MRNIFFLSKIVATGLTKHAMIVTERGDFVQKTSIFLPKASTIQ